MPTPPSSSCVENNGGSIDLANLEVYFTKAVGIGEHSDLQEEIRKWTDVLSNSLDGLESLEQHFNDDGLAK